MTGPARPQPDDLGAWLAALEEAHAKATPGPWHEWHREVVRGDGRLLRQDMTDADAALIVAAVNALPRLIAVHELHQRVGSSSDQNGFCGCCAESWPCRTAAALSVPPTPEEPK